MKKSVMIGIVILAVVVIFVHPFATQCDGHKRLMEDLIIDQSILGTPLEQDFLAVKAEIDAGKDPIPISQVLSEKEDYVCAINYSYGPFSLKVKAGMIKEEILWGDSTTTAYIIDDYVYRWSPMYDSWLRFEYKPDMLLSQSQMTRGILSEFELLNMTDPDNTACVKLQVDEQEFDFPLGEAVDLETVYQNSGTVEATG
jgi:hypothetical protein